NSFYEKTTRICDPGRRRSIRFLIGSSMPDQSVVSGQGSVASDTLLRGPAERNDIELLPIHFALRDMRRHRAFSAGLRRKCSQISARGLGKEEYSGLKLRNSSLEQSHFCFQFVEFGRLFLDWVGSKDESGATDGEQSD